MGRYRKTLMRLLNRPLKQTNTHKYQDSGLLRCFSPRTMRPGALSTMALPLQPIRKCQGPLWTLLTTVVAGCPWPPPQRRPVACPGKEHPFPFRQESSSLSQTCQPPRRIQGNTGPDCLLAGPRSCNADPVPGASAPKNQRTRCAP